MAGAEQVVETAEVDGTRDRRRGLYALIALFIVIILIAWLFLCQTSQVPYVVGMSEIQARAEIEDAGLEVGEVTGTEVSPAPPGTVWLQEPAGGTDVRRGSAVDIVVALEPTAADAGPGPGDEGYGASIYPEPDYTNPGYVHAGEYDEAAAQSPSYANTGLPMALGRTKADGGNLIVSAGYRVTFMYGPSTTAVPVGVVFYQNPAPGSIVSKGTLVTLWVSTGSPVNGDPYPQPD